MSGRAPKLGQDGTTGTFHAVNNYFENMKGHAFDAYTGAQALVEGNVFSSVAQPATAKAATISTFIVDAGSACSSALGRACLANSVDSASGELVGGSTTSFISALKDADVSPLDVSQVAAHVKANAGPAHLGTAGGEVETPVSSMASSATTATTNSTTLATTTKTTATTPTDAVVAATTTKTTTTKPTTTEAPTTMTTTTKLPTPTTTTLKTTLTTLPKPTATTDATSYDAAVAPYGRCGGRGYVGSTSCVGGWTCKVQNEWYSQCV